MSGEPPLVDGLDIAGLQERLRGYARYVALVADQLEALEQGDRTRLRDLHEARAELEREMQGEPPEEDDPEATAPSPAELQEALTAGIRLLELAVETSQATQEEWTRLQDRVRSATVGLRPARVAWDRYPEAEAGVARLDVRF